MKFAKKIFLVPMGMDTASESKSTKLELEHNKIL